MQTESIFDIIIFDSKTISNSHVINRLSYSELIEHLELIHNKISNIDNEDIIKIIHTLINYDKNNKVTIPASFNIGECNLFLKKVRLSNIKTQFYTVINIDNKENLKDINIFDMEYINTTDFYIYCKDNNSMYQAVQY